MSAEIKKQVATEVGSLLDDYVVSPLKNEIQDACSQSTKALDGVKQEAQSAEKNLCSQIGTLRTLLEERTKELSENLEDNIPDAVANSGKAIRADISTLTGTVNTGLTKLEQSLSDAKQSIGDTSQQNAEAFLYKLSLVSQDIEREIKASTGSTEQNIAELNDQLVTLKVQVEALTQQMNDRLARSSAVTEGKLTDMTQKIDVGLFESSQSLERELAELTRQIETGISEASQTTLRELAQFRSAEKDTHTETYRRIDSIAARLEQSHTCVMDHQDKMKAELERYKLEAEKRYKTMLMASLVIGAANLVGLITIALICVL